MSTYGVWVNDTEISVGNSRVDVEDGVAEFVTDIDLGAFGDQLALRVPYAMIAALVHDVQSRNAFRPGDIVRELGGYMQKFRVHSIEDGGATVIIDTPKGLTRIASKHLTPVVGDADEREA